MLALPAGFLAGALELFEIGGGERAHAPAHPVGIGLEALDEFVHPGVTDTQKSGDTVGGPFAGLDR